MIRITPKLQFTDARYFLNFFTLKISFADENDFENQWLEFSGMVNVAKEKQDHLIIKVKLCREKERERGIPTD